MLDRIQGRPYGVAISAGTDGEGAARQVGHCVSPRDRQPCHQPIAAVTTISTL
ncbi:flavodoxin [Bordetella pertussis]|nr:flavodoxin [Bordetella pertussis]